MQIRTTAGSGSIGLEGVSISGPAADHRKQILVGLPNKYSPTVQSCVVVLKPVCRDEEIAVFTVQPGTAFTGTV